MEEAESRASQLTRSKMLLQSQVEELKKQLDEEVKVSVSAVKHAEIIQAAGCSLLCPGWWCQGKQVLSSSLSSARQDCEVLKEQLEEEQESKQEMQRLVSKLNSEVTHWRTKHEAVAVQHTDELEETRYLLVLASFVTVELCKGTSNNRLEQ